MTEEERKRLKIYCFQRQVAASQTFGPELIEKIKTAFSVSAYPGDENLIATPQHLAECWECREYYEYFVGKTWQQCVDEGAYGKLTGGQSFFLPFAWHYYLPAYLIECVNNGYFSSFHFQPPRETDLADEEFMKFWDEWQQKRIDLLSPEQCLVIIEYLKISLAVWEGIERGYEDDTKALHFWKENYRKALAREKNQSQ